VGAPGVPRGAGYPTGPAPGYGPPGYAPGTGPAAWSGQPASARPTQAFDATGGATTATGPTGAATVVATAEEQKKKDLTVNKLVAGAGAAATSAVLGSFFGAMGTVSGAALGSVFSAIVTALYQHSLDKTRDTVKARIKLPGGGTVKVATTTEVPAPRGGADQASTRVFVTPGDQPTEVLSAVPAVDAGPPKSRRRLLVMAGFTVVVFAIGMLAITGIELVKGSPLNTSSSSTSERPGGTSLGSVLGRPGSTEASTETATPSETESAEPTSEATNSDESDEDTSSAVPGRGFGTDEEDDPSTSRVTPTPTPESGADEQSGEGSQSDSGAQQQGGGAVGADEQQ